jgi:hypothetical protein
VIEILNKKLICINFEGYKMGGFKIDSIPHFLEEILVV